MRRRVAGIAMSVLVSAACGRSSGPPRQVGPAAAARRPITRQATTPAAADLVWHYEGAEGPEHWGQLSPRFAACRDGHAQSPIDVPVPVAAGVTPTLAMQFPHATLTIAHHEHVADGVNDGHTIQVTYDDGDTLTLGDRSYELVQYHFHHPSEHTLAGRRFPMEMHMVHRSATGALAVVGVLIAEGRHNDAVEPIWANLPRAQGVAVHYEHVRVDVDALLPTVRTSVRYEGSLTTPPCTEGVPWILLTTPIELDAAQLRTFTAIIHDNSRPVQPRHGRAVVRDEVVTTSR